MRRVIVLSGWIWFLLALPQVTNAAVGLMWFLVLFPSGITIAVSWIADSVARPAMLKTSVTRLSWLSVPALGVLALGLSFTHRDLALRVRVSDSVLSEAAENAKQQSVEDRHSGSRRIGVFVVDHIMVDEEQVYFYTASGFLDSYGIAYCPEGKPTFCSSSEHLYGPWWWFYDRF